MKKANQVRLSTVNAIDLAVTVEDLKKKGMKFSVTLLANQVLAYGIPHIRHKLLK